MMAGYFPPQKTLQSADGSSGPLARNPSKGKKPITKNKVSYLDYSPESHTFAPGLSAVIFKSLKKVSTFIPFKERFCVLLISEIELERHYNFPADDDYIDGLYDPGFGRTNAYADGAVVFMLRSIYGQWKQPLGFAAYDRPMRPEKLVQVFKRIVRECDMMRLFIVASVCPCIPPTIQAYDFLLEETARRSPYKNGHIFLNDQEIIPLFEPASLLNDFRMNLVYNNLFFKVNLMPKLAKWYYVEKAYDVEKSMTYGYLPKIGEAHVVPEKINRRDLKTCIETFSASMASCLKTIAGNDLPSEASQTGDLIEFIDRTFDSVNGCESGDKPLRQLVTQHSLHSQAWEEGKRVFVEMKFIKSPLAHVFNANVCKGWFRTLDGFIQLKYKLLNDIGYTNFAPRMFSLDPMRYLFDVIRLVARVNPNQLLTCRQFVCSYTKVLTTRDIALYFPGHLADENDGLPFLITFHDLQPGEHTFSNLSDI